MSADLQPTSAIIAGQEDVIRLASLMLENLKSEPSPITTLEVTVEAGYRFQRLGNCRSGNFTTTCNLYLEENDKKEIFLEVVPENTIQPHVENISIVVKVTANCLGHDNVIFQELKVSVSVTQSWTVAAEPDPSQKGQTTNWSPEFEEETLHGLLEYDVTNKGPSISRSTQLYVYLPKHPLIQNAKVKFANQDCSEGDMEYMQRPPVVGASSEGMTVFCSSRGDCLVHQCQLPELQKFQKKKLAVSFEFNVKVAEEEADMTRFEVVTSVCVLAQSSSNNDLICSLSGETVTTTTVFQYYPQSPLDVLVDYWQVVVAVVAAIIVFIIVLLLAWRLKLFQRVRLFKNNQEKTNDASPVENETPN